MSPVLYPLLGVGAFAAFIAAICVLYALRWVLLWVGFAGLVTTIGAGTATLFTGEHPEWLPWLAIGSCCAIAICITMEPGR